MTKLETGLNLKYADDFYAALLMAHEGLSEQESAKLNMKLVLLLANHVGDSTLLEEAISAAKAKK